MTAAAAAARPLTVADAPLAGTVVVEASAGTGKTWTIAALVVRLVLERGLRVEDILVVTFTEAATAELRTRVRGRLVELREWLAGASADTAKGAADPLRAWIAGGGLALAREESLRRLDAAINGFDLAPIHTIHAFCQRALTEHAFESGQAFTNALVPDESELVAASVADFWRHATAGAPPAWSAWLRRKKVHPGTLAELLIAVDRKPYARFVPSPEVPPPAGDLAAAYAAAEALWRSGSDEVMRQLQDAIDAGLAPRGRTEDQLRQWCGELDHYFAGGVPDACVPPALRKIAPAHGARPQAKTPGHPFLGAARQLVDVAGAFERAFAAATIVFRQQAIDAARTNLARRKRERALFSYNDLVAQLARALRGDAGARLAATLRTRYRAVLVDEFQDTDPLQAQIFTTAFGRDGDPLYFVGDPKQAIYGFRGADVRAYLRARAGAERRTLLENYRSERGLVAAVNTLFAGDDPFLVPSIGYSPSSASPLSQACTTAAVLPASLGAPFTVWYAPRRDGERVGESRTAIAAALAGEIARLLAAAERGEARIGEAPLSGEHIAVLVKSHSQADLVRQALRRAGVASVTYGQQSVFVSPEAADLERVLLAVSSPSQEGLVRAALATDLLGWTSVEVAALEADERPLERELERFARYREIAERQDFALMLRTLAVEQRVAPRLLALADGERRLTNLLHLAELLEALAAREDLDLAGVVRRLAQARQSRTGEGESEQLRLESDERLVRILTVHAAKGLQFPIVFCPFLWSGTRNATTAKPLAFHAPGEDGEAMFDLADKPDDVHKTLARREALEESLRLAYVALTRAERRVVMVWGPLHDWETSPLGWLLCRGEGAVVESGRALEGRQARGPGAARAPGAVADDPVAAVIERAATAGDAELRERLATLAETSGGNIRVLDLPAPASERRVPADAPTTGFAARPLRGRVPPRWRVASYSLLAARRESETPDHDALALPAPVEPAAPSQPPEDSLPRGARFGDALHHLFEHLDFTRLGQVEAQARDALARFGLPTASASALGALAADVVRAPLDAERRIRLADVPRDRRVDELEFHLPIGTVSPARLAQALSELRLAAGSSAAPPDLVAAVGPGFLRGFVDLVFAADGRFWIADYKSTRVGAQAEDYTTTALARAMTDHLYDLQALLYVLAVDRYLATRVAGYEYERNFGGVFYLFVRGMHPDAPGRGVCFLRPAASLLGALAADVFRTERLVP